MKETRVYVVDSQHIEIFDMDEEPYIDLCETFGKVYFLKGFQEAFNRDEIDSCTSFIRFIEVEVYDGGN